MLDTNTIHRLFDALNDELKRCHVIGEIGICGGAVMCLVFKARESTMDVDEIFEPARKIREAAKKVAAKLGVPEDWLNDAAKGYFLSHPPTVDVLNLSNLRVWAPTAEYMLAMKCISARFDSHDADDVRTLVKHLGLTDSNEVFRLVEEYYPREQIPAKAQYFIEEILHPKALYEKMFYVDRVPVRIYARREDMGADAAAHAAEILREALSSGRVARMIVGSAPSQQEVIGSLANEPGLDWGRIDIFHMDEYLGIDPDHPASFRKWLKDHLADPVQSKRVHYINANADDPRAECDRYAALMNEAPIDLTFQGFGENGHVAFNDPGVADFDDPLTVKIVTMDEVCRGQQVGEGHFASLEHVPSQAITITCSTMAKGRHMIAVVPTQRKAEAVKRAIEGPYTTDCPASMLFVHPSAALYMDADAASLLSQEVIESGITKG